IPQCRRCQTADGELGSAIQELPTVDPAVHVSVEKTKQLRIEVTRLFSLHRVGSLGGVSSACRLAQPALKINVSLQAGPAGCRVWLSRRRLAIAFSGLP